MKKKILIGIGVIVGSVAVVALFFFFREVTGNTNQAILEVENLGRKNNSIFMDYNSTRSSLSTVVKDLSVDKVGTKYNRIVELLSQEEQHIINVRNNVLQLDKYCNGKMYSSSSVNEICFNYQKYYEQMVNSFVSDVTYINRMIQYDNSLKLYQSSEFKNYIDYNKDGVYSGKENLDEN